MQYCSKRWTIETYFRTMKIKLSLERYQVRKHSFIGLVEL
ncbi:hypothetical protein [Bacillus cereus]